MGGPMSGYAEAAETVVRRIETERRLDSVINDVSGLVERVLPTGTARDVLHGVWLGHPLHPVLTDLPIGAWTSATVVDFVGGRRGARAAQLLVGFGCLSAIPTAMAGAADWSRSDRGDQRIGLVHAASNSAALMLYAWSWNARRNGRRGLGILLGLGGASAATAGAYLGGHLVYRRSVGANRTAGIAPPKDWTDAAESSSTPEMRVVGTAEDEILIVEGRTTGISAHCSHAGGPLAEGEFGGGGTDRCVVCPWHGSTFRVDDGAVVHGPATSPQPAYDVRRTGDHWQVRGQTR
jgi:nitrite reductase/ring-hydroxylating ferredoxin subunit/uncharacterized membrane protein